MTLPGEILGVYGAACPTPECGRRLELRKCRSGAGHYLGYSCPEHGPLSRETRYLSDEKADLALRWVDFCGRLPYWALREDMDPTSLAMAAVCAEVAALEDGA